MGAQRIVSLLFSGGCDSTLSAALLTKDFDEIHLVTFKHYATWNVRASRFHAQRLQNKFKDKKFIHVFLNSSALFLQLQRGILQDYPRFPYMTNYFCGACKLAMHAHLVRYNLSQGIQHAASGASYSMAMFPDQNRKGIETLEGFYRSYGIAYHNPVFSMDKTDQKAVELGLLDSRHLKDKHKAKTPVEFLYVPFLNIFYNIQGFCLHIFWVDLYHYWMKRRKPSIDSIAGDAAEQYYSQKIRDVCRAFIEESIRR